jgi:hypothetical protein
MMFILQEWCLFLLKLKCVSFSLVIYPFQV